MKNNDPAHYSEIEWRSPMAAFAPLAGEPHAHLLHAGDQSLQDEWSIIVAFPADVFSACASHNGAAVLADLQAAQNERMMEAGPVLGAPFHSGFVGYFGYEAAAFLEPSLQLPRSPYVFPDFVLGYYEAAAIFSRHKKQAFISGRNDHACKRLRDALGREVGAAREAAPPGAIASNFTSQSFEAAVNDIIENILDGEYYQANLSHQIRAAVNAGDNAFNLYRRLAQHSDAGFAALLQYDEGAVISNSPERFFRISPEEGGRRIIITEPIKGTRPRGGTPQEDVQLARELLADPKDRAENIMIADLMRNDLSRICLDRSICEDSICELRSYANVHHLVSRIRGALTSDVGFVDILRALFPCGSITGAPKLAAMEAITRLEKVGRGPYCGAIGYIDDRGGADFSVAIRTVMLDGASQTLTIPVGGGITLRSDPFKEYMETIHKAQGALAAIGACGEALL